MNFKEIINEIGSKAKKASIKLRTLNADKKKIAYEYLEENIKNKAKDILKANEIDIENAVNNNLAKPLINRLKLNENSISSIIKSIAEITGLSEANIGLKAKTSEKMGFIGKEKGIAAHVVVLLKIE